MCDSPAVVTAMLYKRPELLEALLQVFCRAREGWDNSDQEQVRIVGENGNI